MAANAWGIAPIVKTRSLERAERRRSAQIRRDIARCTCAATGFDSCPVCA